MNKRNTTRGKTLTALTLAAALAGVLSGCGGGGNAGSPNKTVTGTLLDYLKAPIVNARAVYDSGAAGTQTTVTSPTGAYTFVVPLSSITGSDTLTFYDAAGNLIDITPITLQKNADAVTITTISPPAPPTPPAGV